MTKAKLDGLKIAVCQMNIVQGRPDANARYMIGEIAKARQRKADIIAFPEACTTGYLIGDKFEDADFMDDVMFWIRRIVSASRGITVIFGSPVIDHTQKGEDGRPRKHNAAIIAHDGKTLGTFPWGTIKSLQPHYRFFGDGKHFYSMRNIAEALDVPISGFFDPVEISTSIGLVKMGVILCEDMWHGDYTDILNPTKHLVTNGAEIIFNLSASPWGWQKNRKRHQVVHDLLKECPVPFVYVNNTGAQNPGKNLVMFDGSSAVYNHKGEIIFEIAPYIDGTHDLKFSEVLRSLPDKPQDDSRELYDAMAAGVKYMVKPHFERIVIGLSGGIDSAVVAALMTDVFGLERVIGVNMPFRNYNSDESKDIARQIAHNLGIEYLVRPVDAIVAAIARDDIREDDFEFENIQATARMTALSKLAKKYRGVFTCNSNKVEMAFGYSTLYGDLAGFYAPLGDLVKREVRQIADYINCERFRRIVIPEECINAVPTAGLRPNQVDPFDYGDLSRRGYHDEMVRAFTEFRKDAQWFLELYIEGRLETELHLEPGTLARLFPTKQAFLEDLRRCWELFHNSWFKRNQAPFIPVYSKRAFGRDLEESLIPAHYTERFHGLERKILAKPQTQRPQIAIFGGSFSPPHFGHINIARKIADIFDKVIIVPCGIRGDKPSTGLISPQHRKEMILLTFKEIPNAEFDFYDLENNVFTPHYLLAERYARAYPDAKIWFVVGGDLISGGKDGNAEIQGSRWQKGKEIWEKLNFVVITHELCPIDSRDLPPNSQVIEVPGIIGRSSRIRALIAAGEPFDKFVVPEVHEYIRSNRLYSAKA